MARETPATTEARIPRPIDYSPNLTARSLSTPFRLDEGYSDETRSLPDKDLLNPPADHVMSPPDWILAQSEADRAELAYSLLRTLRTSTVAAVVERLAPLLHMDPVLKLPPEITSEIFSYLDPQTLLTASLASRAWRSRIFDSRLWRDLYISEGWRVDIDAVHAFEREQSGLSSPQSRKPRSRHADTDFGEPRHKKRVPPSWLDSRTIGAEESNAATRENGPPVFAQADTEGDHLMSDASEDRNTFVSPGQLSMGPGSRRESLSGISFAKSAGQAHSSASSKSSLLIRMSNGTVKINWPHLYRQRRRLEDNWVKGRFTNFQLPHPSHMEEAHKECVYAIQFSGKWLVSGSRDKTVRVWDLNTKRLWYRPLVGHTKSVLCLQFDPRPSEDIIVSGSSDKNVIVWRFSTGEKLHEIAAAHDDSVLNLRFDERYLVTCSKDKLIKVWNRRDLTPADKDYPAVSRGSGVTYPSYIVDTSEIPSPILEAEIANNHLRSLAPFSLLMTLEGHTAAVNAIQMNEDEIVSASGDRLIKIWNVRNGACKKTLIGHEKGIACVQFDNQRIVSGSNDDTVRIFDHISGAEVACLHGHGNLVRTVQAGFGDPPGAEEALRLEALAVDREFLNAQRMGEVVDLSPAALKKAGYQQNTTGSRNPRDIKALGARIPPGGGGSRWGRIVSGSYDESIIIWKKDSEGQWVVSQRLRQADAAANASYGPFLNRHPRQTSRANAFAQQAQAQAASQGQNSWPAPAAGHLPVSMPPPQAPSSSSSAPAPVGNAQQGSSNPTPTLPQWAQELSGPSQQHTSAAAQARPALQGGGQQNAHPQANRPNPNGPVPGLNYYANPRARPAPPTQPPTSRIFKIQFDARKIICASQDPRIVGWDFVCDDEELDEACQFFTGL